MKNVYTFLGGRKVFWALVCLGLLTFGAYKMQSENYRTFEAGVFAIYASMVLGNVGTKFIYAKNSKNEE